MTVNTRGALELAQQIFAARSEQSEIRAQRNALDEQQMMLKERDLVVSGQLEELEEKFNGLLVNGAPPAVSPAVSGSAPSAPAPDDDDDDNGDDTDEEDANLEENESARARVLAFYERQPGKKIPLLVAIEALSDIPAKSVRSYTSKFAKPGGPIKRARRGVYKYIGESKD